MGYRKIVNKLQKTLPPGLFRFMVKVKRIPNELQSMYLERKYSFLNKYNKNSLNNYGWFGLKRLVVVNLTTFPARINKVYLTIETIMRQTSTPDSIILWLAKDEFPNQKKDLPKRLLDLEKRGLKIRFTDINLRSHNKVIHALKKYPDAINISVDDDIFYPKTFIEEMIKTHKKYPDDVICYRAHQIKLNSNKTPRPYKEWFDYEKTIEARHDIIALGVSGILYPPHSLHKDVFDYDMLKEICLYNDDVWFKAMAMINDTKHRRIKNKNIHFPMIRGTQDSGLFHKNVDGDRNDKAIKNVFKRYNLQRYL